MVCGRMARSSLLLLLLAGCGSTPPPPTPDAGETPDASVQEPDAGLLDAGVVDAGVRSSGGSGGVTCMSSTTLDATHSACLADVNGTKFKLTTPAGGSGPYVLGIYLHGDGAGAYNSNSAVRRMLPLADSKHVLQVAVLAPNKCSWWQAPSAMFDAQCANVGVALEDTAGENAEALAAVIDAVRAAYDVRDDLYLYYSASGGSIFLTRRFIPVYGEAYPGGMSINCGGEMPPDDDFMWATHDASARGTTQLFFTYGDQDFLAADSHATALGYRARDFVVDEKVLPNVGHCGPTFDAHGRALEVWTQVLGP